MTVLTGFVTSMSELTLMSLDCKKSKIDPVY